MKIKEILTHIEKSFPLEKQESWDHTGLQLGNVEDECQRVLLCLNVDESTIQQAIEHHCELIISHHPFIFHAIQQIDTATIQGNNIKQLILNDISVYSMHTNYDAIRMNSLLLSKMGCKKIQQVDESGICIRAGHHCAQLLTKWLECNGTLRASFYIYNDYDDVDRLVDVIKRVIKFFKELGV